MQILAYAVVGSVASCSWNHFVSVEPIHPLRAGIYGLLPTITALFVSSIGWRKDENRVWHVLLSAVVIPVIGGSLFYPLHEVILHVGVGCLANLGLFFVIHGFKNFSSSTLGSLRVFSKV